MTDRQNDDGLVGNFVLCTSRNGEDYPMWTWLMRLVAPLMKKAADTILEEVSKKVSDKVGDHLAAKRGPLTPADLTLPPDVHVVPKGLRSFDEEDAKFFIHLLPGPFRGDCLPECIHFWKSRIETTNPDKTFRVGVLYGLSGCGKSSLVKAGLIPNLAADRIIPVYVEVTATDTKNRLLAALRTKCPFLVPKGSLRAALRRKEEIPNGKKVLIVLDQFEQYLHATSNEDQEDLIDALRECDGEKLLCVLMVRGEFFPSVTRFMQRVEIPLSQDRNLAMLDLFDNRHAKKVLALLGRGYGALQGTISADQDSFLDQAVADLAEGDYVPSVRLALFAQMVKAKDWKPPTLRAVGGARGIGVTFLEESFVVESAPPENRRYRRAAAQVLKALLPETGSDIKGGMRSERELLEKSGYNKQPNDFKRVVEILDQNLRLITPTDAPAVPAADGETKETLDTEKCYQLAHDYLVPSLRKWLTRKQRETWRGRAEFRLAERATLWNARPENHRLPGWWESLNLRLLTRKKDWTAPQRKMMQKVWRYYRKRLAILVVILIGIAAYYQVKEYGLLRLPPLPVARP